MGCIVRSKVHKKEWSRPTFKGACIVKLARKEK